MLISATGSYRESLMRIVLIAIIAVLTATAVHVTSSNAQGSFFNERFCTYGGGGGGFSSGAPDCAFHTWEQCIASARGLGRYCTTNPWWHGSSQKPITQAKSRRRNR